MHRMGIAVLLCLPAVLTGCQNTLVDRSLIFSTGTTLGLEVSASPTDASAPAKIVLGYKRAEGVLNPVFYNHNSDALINARPSDARVVGSEEFTTQDYYLPQAYSVIAKFEGTASAKAAATVDGGIGLSQWFATGPAAEILAESGAAAVLTDNAGVARAAATASATSVPLLGTSGGTSTFGEGALSFIYQHINEQAEDGVAEAIAIRTSLNKLAGTLPETYPFTVFTDADPYDAGSAVARATFQDVMDYLADLKASRQTLTTELEAAEAASPPDATKVAGLKALIQQTDAEYTRVQKAVSESPAFRTAIAATIGNQENP